MTMEFRSADELRAIWAQKALLVLWRDTKKAEPRMRLPYNGRMNRAWLRNGRSTKSQPVWHDATRDRFWTFPKAWVNVTIRRSVEHFGGIYIVQPYRKQEVCAPACWKAEGHTCSCSCGGARHGEQSGEGFYVVSETFAVKWGLAQLAYRLLTRTDRQSAGALQAAQDRRRPGAAPSLGHLQSERALQAALLGPATLLRPDIVPLVSYRSGHWIIASSRLLVLCALRK